MSQNFNQEQSPNQEQFPNQGQYSNYSSCPPQIHSPIVWSILVTIFCSLPCGIVSIIYALKVKPLVASGQYAQAQQAVKVARTCILVSVVYCFFWFSLIILIGAYPDEFEHLWLGTETYNKLHNRDSSDTYIPPVNTPSGTVTPSDNNPSDTVTPPNNTPSEDDDLFTYNDYQFRPCLKLNQERA